jgi:2-polyprenyl-6-hydroxyphenyl methylase/3-demethylubiquinone-9 3-methyltransferase
MQNTWKTSIDENRDQALFDRIAEKYCRKDLRLASRIARKLRLQQTVQHVLTGTEQRILDLGCGAGFSAQYLYGRYSEYVGVDYSEQLINLANRYINIPEAKFYAANICDMQFECHFDGVIMIGVLHHLGHPDEAVSAVSSCLKPGGWFAVNEPSSHNTVINAARNFRKRLDRDYSEEQLALSREDLKNILVRNGFTDINIYAQGILSTPFAEVVLIPSLVTVPFAWITAGFDRLLESIVPSALSTVSWNLVAIGRKA